MPFEQDNNSLPWSSQKAEVSRERARKAGIAEHCIPLLWRLRVFTEAVSFKGFCAQLAHEGQTPPDLSYSELRHHRKKHYFHETLGCAVKPHVWNKPSGRRRRHYLDERWHWIYARKFFPWRNPPLVQHGPSMQSDTGNKSLCQVGE